MSWDGSLAADVDVLVFGGGIAGLWTLHVLLAHGYDAHLVESDALGSGQSVQAQGIVHGGGKYALRSVGDVDAMRSIRDMPDRWRAHHGGTRRDPDLRAATMVNDGCWLWLPKGSWTARLQAIGLVPLLRHGGVLACPPQPRPRDEWPEVLREHAQRALLMAEPVLDTRSVLEALREPIVDRLLRVDGPAKPDDLGPCDPVSGSRRVRLRAPDGTALEVVARSLVFTAGQGNAALLAGVKDEPGRMQERPLLMTVLRGRLPRLHGHCISGGRTRITVTSLGEGDDVVWQIGGEVSESNADAKPGLGTSRDALAEIRACLPGIDLSGARIGHYRAVRAEARDGRSRRPSGAHVESIGPGLVVAWPTKWALAPLLAEDVLEILAREGVETHGPRPLHGSGRWPRPVVAPFPWEDCAWTDVSSVAPA